MANFGQLVLTNAGIQAQYKAQSGEPLKFKRIGMGSGNYSGNVMALTKLVTENVSVDISKGYMQNNAFVVEGFFSNDGLQTGFAWREIGVFVEGTDGNEVLYCYANAGNSYDYIPATADERYSKYIRIATAIGNATAVSIVESEGILYVDTLTFKTAIDQLQPSKERIGANILIEDSANLPFLHMTIYGKSTQDGEPTPDAPIDIANAGDSGNINVGIYRKNLAPESAFAVMGTNGASNTYDASTHTITMNADGTGLSGRYCSPCKGLLPGTTYTVSFDIRGTVGKAVRCGWDKSKISITLTEDYVRYSKAFVATKNTEPLSFYTDASSGGLATGEYMQFANVQIEAGNIATEFEPCDEQRMEVSTPDSLCGIRVSYGGNYTDTDGQQWVCDKVDFEQGIAFKRINHIVLTGNEGGWYLNGSAADGETRLFQLPYLNYAGSKESLPGALCTHAGRSENTFNSDSSCFCIYNTSGKTYIRMRTEAADLNEFKAFLAAQYAAGTPVTIHYDTQEETETALSDSQIAAYMALVANNPCTTVLNDAGAGMKVKYVTKSHEDILSAGRTFKGIIRLTEGVHYGDTLPAEATKGRIFFKKVSS